MWKDLLFHTATVALLLLAGWAGHATAQTPLFLANERTTVRSIAFQFTDADRYTPAFEPEVLKEQIATRAPGFLDKTKRILPFLEPNTYLLDRIELQKDVVRLRRFYHQNGYISPRIDYGESRLDTTRNALQILFSIDQGPSIIIQDVAFYSPDGGYAASLFAGEMRDRWITFRDRTSFRTGDRFTTFDLVRIQDAVLTWLKDQGYAFARLATETEIDSTAYTADIAFELDPGPRGYFSEILIEGNRRVNDRVVRRELPFREGDVFSNTKLVQSQRELFALNLFRVALADVPPAVDTSDALQPDQQLRDSTVTVRIRVREANLRYLTAQTGYDQQVGVTLVGQWSHRNFSGGARTLTVRGEARTGLLATPPEGSVASRLFRGSVALRQPYLFTNHLTGIFEPFIQAERDALLSDTDLFLKINRWEFGTTTILFYEILPFRTVSLQYELSRAHTFGVERDSVESRNDAYSKSIISLSGTFGWANNFLNPRRGFLVRPLVEQGGGLERLFGLGPSGIEFFKTGVELVGYIPITRRIHSGVRLTGGRLWPTGQSAGTRLLYTRDGTAVAFSNLFAGELEDRFDAIRFYAGGSNDVRGWDWRLIGPRVNRTACASDENCTRDENGRLVFTDEDGDGLPNTINNQFEAAGGLTKVAGNIEVRFPFPGLGNAWRAAVFLDFGQVSSRVDDARDCTLGPFFKQETDGTMEEVDVQCGFKDDGRISLGNFKYGVGGGIRYATPIGYVRFDLAYKLNPDDLDLQTPRNAFLAQEGLIDPKQNFLRHFNLHLSLGQAF